MQSTFKLKPNSVAKAVSKEGTDIHTYIKQCGLIQLVPSTDEQGEICLVYTNIGLLTIYIEWGKIVCYHRLATYDMYITEYSVKGVYIADELESLYIEMYSNF